MAIETDDDSVSAATKANWFTSASIALSAGGELVTDIELDVNTKAVTVGTPATLTATLTPAGNTTQVTWASSDDSIVEVAGAANTAGTSVGTLTGKRAGTAVISASVGSVRVLCAVTVSE